MTEQQFMDAIIGADNWNNGLFFPFVNDCHNDLERAFENVGVEYPGAPNGRFDADDVIRDESLSLWKTIKSWINWDGPKLPF